MISTLKHTNYSNQQVKVIIMKDKQSQIIIQQQTVMVLNMIQNHLSKHSMKLYLMIQLNQISE